MNTSVTLTKFLLSFFLLLSSLIEESKGQGTWLPCYEPTLITGTATCSTVDSVIGCDFITYSCADEALFNYGVTHFTHDTGWFAQPCHADFMISELSGVYTFTDSSYSVSGNYSYAWDFGDGNTSNDVFYSSHSYSGSGYYVVTLSIVDTGNCSSTSSRVILVNGTGGCNALFSSSLSGYIATFTNLSTGNYDLSEWDFGDLTTSTDTNPVHDYVAAGTYIVHLFVSDSLGNCNSGYTDSVIIGSSCQAYFTMYPDTVPHNWFAVNSALGILPMTYDWSWGDGSTSTGPTPSHTYASAGYYTICLSISDAMGCTSTYCDSSTYIYKLEKDQSMITVTVVTSLPNAVQQIPAAASEISIYPNPATDELTVQLLNNLSAKNITVTDVLGREIYSHNTNLKSEIINLKSFADGVYFLKVQLESGSTEVKRFIKE